MSIAEYSNPEDTMQSIVDEFECPVCVSLMVPPIRMCIVGHSFCDPCNSKLEKCPICRGTLRGDKVRNCGLENVFRKLTLPCPNAEKGCTVQVQGSTFKKHMENCQFTIKMCPLRAVNNCRWKGSRRDSLEHCIEQHPSNTFVTSKIHLIYPRFQQGYLLRPNGGGDTFHLITQAHGELFKCVGDFNPTTGLMIWSLICLNPEAKPERFYLEMVLQNVENPSHDMPSFGRAWCQGIQEGTFQVSRLECDTGLLRNLSGARGVYFTISICEFEGVREIENLTHGPVWIDPAEIDCFCIPQPSTYLDLNDPTLDTLRSFVCEFEEEDALV